MCNYPFFLLIYINLIILWLCWVFTALCRASWLWLGGPHSCSAGPPVAVACLAVEHRLWGQGLRQLQREAQPCALQPQGVWACVAVAQGSVTWLCVNSSQTRDRTLVSCTGRQILSHCVPGMSQLSLFNMNTVQMVLDFLVFHSVYLLKHSCWLFLLDRTVLEKSSSFQLHCPTDGK